MNTAAIKILALSLFLNHSHFPLTIRLLLITQLCLLESQLSIETPEVSLPASRKWSLPQRLHFLYTPSMGIEIERKFLVTSDAWRYGAIGEAYCQGYLSQYPHPTIRVRTQGRKAFLTVKGKINGISRPEFEYEIPFAEAQELQQLCITPLVTKTRYKILHEGMTWEVDEFHGKNEGLIIAEVELDHPESLISKPSWIGQEVSDDPRYANSNLAIHPFMSWK